MLKNKIIVFAKINFEKYYFRKKEETERKEEEEKLAKLKEEKAAIEAAKEKEKENSNKAEVKTEKKSDEPMETEDIGELDEADLQLPNGRLIFFCAKIDVLGLFFRRYLELMGP